MDGARWLAADRGAFDEPEQAEPVVQVEIVAQPFTFRLLDVLSEDDLLMWFSFRESLPEQQ